MPVLIGTGGTNARETIALSQHAQQAGADGIVVINPYYWKVSEANLIRYFEQVADSVTLPVMLYNFPALTGQDLTPALVKTPPTRAATSSASKTPSTPSPICAA